MSSKEKVLQVALELFFKKGYLATSVDDLIEQAGVSKSNFYYHFKSKEDLGVAVLEHRSADLELIVRKTLCNPDITPKDRLRKFLDFLVDAQDAHYDKCGCPFGNLVAEMSEHSERFRCQLSQMFGGLTSSTAEVIAEGQRRGDFRRDVDSGDMATLVVQTVQGMMLLTKCHKSVECLGRGAKVLVRLIEAP
jgi:TetR/AcrR family transcriptional regulator, transcriptional repressor for nem operon